ncbi:hypothetical protein AB5J55_41980 [Streptomyces sp. R11]|uniref:Integral membrane protein n=1 Tax=Streptomyces sp. R11 TaxID=3238625 RepID=A0AB39NE54_9ACTN
MLDVPQTVRVTGDERAAIHRRVDDVDAESRGESGAGRPVPEAYVWCQSRYEHVARASWLVLLPFALINLAHWMLPAAGGHVRAIRLYGLLVRLTALTLTVLLVAASCEVVLDLAAWQCAGSRVCAQEHSWLRFLSPVGSAGGWWSQPGRRLVMAALAPAAFIGLLWWLSCRTWSAYESQQPVPRSAGSDDDNDHGSALSRPGFWYGQRLVARLRAAHVAAGFLTVAAAVGTSAGRYDRASGHRAGLEVLSWVFDTALCVGAVVVLWVVCRRGRSEHRLDRQIDTLVMRYLPTAALVLLAAAMLYAGWSRPDWRSSGRMPGGAAFSIIAIVQCVFVIALGVVARLLYRSRPDPRTALRGLAGPAVALLACTLGAVLSGGMAQRAGDWLNNTDESIAGPPVLLTWQASAAPPLLLVLLAVFAWLAWRTRQVSRQERAHVESDYPGEIRDTVRTRRIASKRARAALIDRSPLVIGVASGGSLALCMAGLTGAFVTEKGPSEAAQGAGGLVQGTAEAAQALGSWLMVVGFLLFLAWSHHAYKGQAGRRTITVLDMGTFWPRAAHPLAPPCYAERAVPDVAWRITTWSQTTGGRLALSAHGQGSVLVAAAICQLSPSLRRRVALQTYGSPLERLYGRWFPAHFGPASLTALHGSVQGWRNLYRLTDPVGGPIRLAGDHGPAVDRAPLVDPLALGRTAQHPLPAPILGNVGYQTDPAFAEEEAKLLAGLRPAVTPRSASALPAAAPGGDARTGPPQPPSPSA